MGLTNDMANALATKAGAVLNIQNYASTPVVAIAETPFIFVGPPKITQIIPGSWDTRLYRIPMTLLIQRVREDADQTAINDFLDLVIAAFRTGITLGLSNPQPIAEIRDADTDKFYSLGGTDYQGIEFGVYIEVYGPQSYTA